MKCLFERLDQSPMQNCTSSRLFETNVVVYVMIDVSFLFDPFVKVLDVGQTTVHLVCQGHMYSPKTFLNPVRLHDSILLEFFVSTGKNHRNTITFITLKNLHIFGPS